MLAAVYYNNKDVRLEERPIPKLQEGEFLFKVMASGVCGSDVMEWYRIKKAPRVLGHEATGEIVETERNCRYKVGQRVFVSHHVPCNECHYCLNGQETACELLHSTNFDPGGFAEYVRVPRINIDKNGVYLLPKNVSYEEGTFIEPLACVVRGQRIADVKKDDTLLILGSGISGLLHLKLARAKGVKNIIMTDINENRLRTAKKFGATEVINARDDVPSIVKRINSKYADKVIVCASAVQAAEQAMKSVDKGGSILFFAVPEPGVDIKVPINDFWRNQVTVMTSYGAAPRDLEESFQLISDGKIKVDDLITHKLPLKGAQEAFRLVAEADESIKVIIEPHQKE